MLTIRMRSVLPLLASAIPYNTNFRRAALSTRAEDGIVLPMAFFINKTARPSAPCIVCFHGGAFLLEELRSSTNVVLELAQKTGAHVLLPKYRLATKHPYPAALQDCYAAYLFAHKNAEKLGVNPNKLVLYGDSAGGNLAAGVALRLRDNHAPLPCLQMLLYPALDWKMQSLSAITFTSTPVWNSKTNAIMWRKYLRGWQGPVPAYASPLYAASLTGLPPAYLETAEHDPLRDEGRAYGSMMQQAGVDVVCLHTEGTVHGYDVLNPQSSITRHAMNQRQAAVEGALRRVAGNAPDGDADA